MNLDEKYQRMMAVGTKSSEENVLTRENVR